MAGDEWRVGGPRPESRVASGESANRLEGGQNGVPGVDVRVAGSGSAHRGGPGWAVAEARNALRLNKTEMPQKPKEVE